MLNPMEEFPTITQYFNQILVPEHLILFLVLNLNFSYRLWFLNPPQLSVGSLIHLLKEITFVVNQFCTSKVYLVNGDMKDRLHAAQSLMKKTSCKY